MRYATLSAALLLLASPAARAQEAEAKALAQEILDQGAALYDKEDAAAMAATYTDDAELILIAKDQSSGAYRTQVTRGRGAIQSFYQKLFDDRPAGAKAKNMVEFAHRIGPDLLLIHGRFSPNGDQGSPIPFTQVRTRQGDRWLILNLQVYVVNEG